MEMLNTARVSLSHFACFVCLFCFVSLMSKLRYNLPLQINVQKLNFIWQPKFYLGYLRGRSFPAPPPSPPPKKIFLSLQYISNSNRKTIQTRRGQCTHCNISQNCVSKCARLHLSAYSFKKKFPGRTCLRTPLGNLWPSATRDFSPKR